jgi:transcriptional regulator with XRE-family HTH domain
MTQEELADRANVSRDLVAKLEQGQRHTARIASLASFARALDVELSALFERATPVLETEDGEAANRVARRNAQTDRHPLGPPTRRVHRHDPDPRLTRAARRLTRKLSNTESSCV